MHTNLKGYKISLIFHRRESQFNGVRVDCFSSINSLLHDKRSYLITLGQLNGKPMYDLRMDKRKNTHFCKSM